MPNKFEFTTVDEILKGKPVSISESLPAIYSKLNLLRSEATKPLPSFDFMVDKCYELVSYVPIPIHIYHDTFILRARPNEVAPFTSVKDLTYNSTRPDLIKSGRFNLERESMFYGAAPIEGHNISGQFSCMFESSKDIFDNAAIWSGKAFTVGKFNVTKPIYLLVLAFYEEAFRKSLHIRNICHPFIVAQQKYSEEDQKKCYLFNSFFSIMAGINNEIDNTYLITTAFYHAVRRYYGDELGILYSSSTTENHGINIVLTPELANGYLKLDTAIQFDMERNPVDFFNIKGMPTKHGKADKDGNFKLETITDISLIK